MSDENTWVESEWENAIVFTKSGINKFISLIKNNKHKISVNEGTPPIELDHKGDTWCLETNKDELNNYNFLNTRNANAKTTVIDFDYNSFNNVINKYVSKKDIVGYFNSNGGLTASTSIENDDTKITIGHTNNITANTVQASCSSNEFKIPSIKYDAHGHITEVTTTNYYDSLVGIINDKIKNNSNVTGKVSKTGDVMSGELKIETADALRIGNSTNKVLFRNDTRAFYILIDKGKGNSWDEFPTTNGEPTAHPFSIDFDNGYTHTRKLYGAVYNDYAEFRKTVDFAKAGQCVIENGNGTMSLSHSRLQLGANIISDTYGFSIGESNKCQTPIAVAGRVLAYPYEDISVFTPGAAVCSAPSGTISIMTREEIKEWPDAIVGYVSEIPGYEYWGEDNVKVDGRLWIKIK